MNFPGYIVWDSVSQRSQLCTRQREFCCAWKTFIIPLLNTSLYTNLRAEFQEKAWLALPPLLPTGSLCLPTHIGSRPPQGLLSAASPAWNTFPPEPHTSDSSYHFGFKSNVTCPESSSLTPLSGGQKLQPMGQTHPTSLFGQPSAWFSHFFNGWGKIKRRIFCDTWKLHEIHMSVSVNKALLGYSYTYLFAV